MEKLIKTVIKETNSKLECFTADYHLENEIHKAINYTLFNGGRRFRSLLLYILAQELGIDKHVAIHIGAAIEMLHCSTLVHDDLPALDNDDYRRNQLTCHRKFSESTAILVGDALISEAYYWLAHSSLTIPENLKLRIISEASYAMSSSKIINGQVLDLSFTKTGDIEKDYENIINIYLLKTSQLISLPCKIAFLLAEKSDAEIDKIVEYAENLGLIFQFADDLEDKGQESTNVTSIFNEDTIKETIEVLKEKCNKILTELNLEALSPVVELVIK